MSSSPTPLAVVTGASGYVAGDVIAELLSRGFRVRGTVRNLADASKTQTLRDRFPALELFEADLLVDGSFASAFAGADYVLHTASPVLLAAENPQRDLIDPAVDGTENVIRAALATPTVSRIVLTSSVVAIMSASPPPAGTVFTEADWNADATLDNQPYYLSKRLAEQAAWQLVRDYQQSHPERAIGLAVINPSLVFGPPASGRVEGLSVSLFKGIINGQFKDGAPPMNFSCVDVRDVARAHVEALLRPEAAGHRFIVSQEEPASFVEIADLLRAAGGRLAELPLPTTLLAPITYHARFSNEKTRTILGIEPTPLARTVVDLANYLLDNNQVNQ